MKNIRRIQIFLMAIGISLLIAGIASLFMINYIESGLSFYLLLSSVLVNTAWIVIFQYDRDKRKEAEEKARIEAEKYEPPLKSGQRKKKKKKK